MPRRSEISGAFVAAIHKNPKGYQCLRTADFVRELRNRNWHYTLADANKWIERYQTGFVDKTPDTSENRLWMLRSMGYVQ